MMNIKLKVSAEDFKKKLNIKDGLSPTKEELVSLIKPLIPVVKNGNDGVSGKDGADGINGADGSPDTPEEVVAKINESTDKINPKQVKGLEKALREIDNYGKNPSMGGGGGGNLDSYQVSKRITYNTDGTLASVSSQLGDKTFVYSSGVLVSMSGSGTFRSKTFDYAGNGSLTNVNVS